ncbi:MAG: hypothetical protein PHI37_01120 [Candidatus Gracilibacteria bacterium]|nr:hypothetical protein [Candidatus Gracilibacteria bacterium]
MKFFKNNIKALTLVELITSVAISGVLLLLIFVFLSDSIKLLLDNNVKVSSVDEGFNFKDTMGRFVRGGYSEAIVFSGVVDSTYTGTTNPSPNDVLYLKKLDMTQGMLVGIVDIETKKIQKNYVYGNNFLGYRYLSPTEMAQIDLDNSIIYTKEFTNDKIFQNLRMKDFRVKTYNYGGLIDFYFSVVNLFDESLFDKDYADFYIDKLVIDEYNLVY